MTINQTFKIQCPSCHARNKMVSKCILCRQLCCSDCSPKVSMCIDCYCQAKKKLESWIYFSEKEAGQ